MSDEDPKRPAIGRRHLLGLCTMTFLTAAIGKQALGQGEPPVPPGPGECGFQLPSGKYVADTECENNPPDEDCNKPTPLGKGDDHDCGVFHTGLNAYKDEQCSSIGEGMASKDEDCGKLGNPNGVHHEDKACVPTTTAVDLDCATSGNQGELADDNDCSGVTHSDLDCSLNPTGSFTHSDGQCGKPVATGGHNTDASCGGTKGGDRVAEDGLCGKPTGSQPETHFEDSTCGKASNSPVPTADEDCTKSSPAGGTYSDENCDNWNGWLGGWPPSTTSDQDCGEPAPGGGKHPDNDCGQSSGGENTHADNYPPV